jgi:hypothetical protein
MRTKWKSRFWFLLVFVAMWPDVGPARAQIYTEREEIEVGRRVAREAEQRFGA